MTLLAASVNMSISTHFCCPLKNWYVERRDTTQLRNAAAKYVLYVSD
jgi:hypothetical protein